MGRTSHAPGPGNYSIDSLDFIPGKGKFHMGTKLSPSKPTTNVPGAGQYDPDANKVI